MSADKMTRATGLVVLVLAACTNKEAVGDKHAVDLVSGDAVEIEAIVKGDELVVRKGDREANLRLLGIHAFEAVTDDPGLGKLRDPVIAHLRKKAIGKRVVVTLGSITKDPHGRYLGYAAHDGVELNEQLIREGYVLAYTEFPHAKEGAYLLAETAARQAHKGIWRDDGTLSLFKGLRRQWAEARGKRTGETIDDPLLREPPSDAQDK
ncbi:thermonuclease family protein [Myxococcota bacterium]